MIKLQAISLKSPLTFFKCHLMTHSNRERKTIVRLPRHYLKRRPTISQRHTMVIGFSKFCDQSHLKWFCDYHREQNDRIKLRGSLQAETLKPFCISFVIMLHKVQEQVMNRDLNCLNDFFSTFVYRKWKRLSQIKLAYTLPTDCKFGGFRHNCFLFYLRTTLGK